MPAETVNIENLANGQVVSLNYDVVVSYSVDKAATLSLTCGGDAADYSVGIDYGGTLHTFSVAHDTAHANSTVTASITRGTGGKMTILDFSSKSNVTFQ
jgi:hypothetical protein